MPLDQVPYEHLVRTFRSYTFGAVYLTYTETRADLRFQGRDVHACERADGGQMNVYVLNVIVSIGEGSPA